MIQNIEVTKLYPHINNPRKDLGDLTELAESIKANGILQNLTVVPRIMGSETIEGPWQNGYTIVIGHRRLAAAKLAGLKEVPCAIAEMTDQEQVATMLLENMQRSDLTVYEQAQGFQQLILFGDNVGEVAEKTGFSETTIRRRVKLLELDQEKFKASVARGATLFDFAELDKIKDTELKNKVLESVGTPNFRNDLQRAIDSEKKKIWLAGIIEQLEKFAIKAKDTPPGCRYNTTYYCSRDDEIEIPADAGEVKYYYVLSEYGYVSLYVESKQTENDAASAAAAKEKENLRKVRYKALEEITKRANGLRREYVRTLSNAAAKKKMGFIIEHLISVLMDGYISIDEEDFADLLGVTLDKDTDFELESIVEELRKQPDRYMLVAAYCLLEEERISYFSYDCTYSKNVNLDRVYNFIETLGYQISDEEQALRDGTHELFMPSED